MKKSQLSLFEDELELYYKIKSITTKKNNNESTSLELINKGLGLITSAGDLYDLLMKTFKYKSDDCFNLLLNNIIYLKDRDALYLINECIKTYESYKQPSEEYYIDYKSRIGKLIASVDSSMFINKNNNQEIRKIILNIINTENLWLFSVLCDSKFMLDQQLVFDIINTMIAKKQKLMFNVVKELVKLTDVTPEFLYNINDILLAYMLDDTNTIDEIYLWFNDKLKVINKSNNIQFSIADKENLLTKHTKFMPTEYLFYWFDLILWRMGIHDIRYSNNDNILHKLILAKNIYKLFAKIINSESCLKLLFLPNDYNQTPLDMISKLSDLNGKQISVILFALKTIIKENDENYKYVISFEDSIRSGYDITDFTRESLENYAMKETHENREEKISLLNIAHDLTEYYKKDESLYHVIYESKDIDLKVEELELGTEDVSKDLMPWLDKMIKSGGSKKHISNIQLKENLGELRATFPNFAEFIDYIENYMYLNDMGDGFFHLPPALLVSPPGIGKTFFLSTLAKIVGVDNVLISMESVTAGFLLTGSSSQWRSGQPGLIFKNIYNAKYANNIFILDEIDKCAESNYTVDSVLLPLLESHTAKSFRDEFITIPMDIRKTVWVATANNIDKISEPVKSRFQIFEIKKPSFNERKILIQAIYNTVLKDHVWGQSFEKAIDKDVLNSMAQDGDSSRDIRKSILQACGKAARRNDKKITFEDLETQAYNNTSIWDKRNDQ